MLQFSSIWIEKILKGMIFPVWGRGRGGISLRKQPTFRDATSGFPAKWRLRNEHRNSILMTRNYPDLGSASDWLKQISHAHDHDLEKLMKYQSY